MAVDQTLISSDPEIMSGMPVFAGARVSARTLFDYLQEGHNLDEFLDDFPTGSRQQAQAVLASSDPRSWSSRMKELLGERLPVSSIRGAALAGFAPVTMDVMPLPESLSRCHSTCP